MQKIAPYMQCSVFLPPSLSLGEWGETPSPHYEWDVHSPDHDRKTLEPICTELDGQPPTHYFWEICKQIYKIVLIQAEPKSVEIKQYSRIE